MYSKVMMLLWERWRRTHWAVIAACLLPVSGRLIYMAGSTPQENAVQLTAMYWNLGYMLLVVWLLVGQCEVRHMDLAFPNRLFKLPVCTTTFVTVYLGYGVVSMALPFLIFFGFEKLFLDSNSYPWSTLFMLETLYIVLQALSWLGGPARFLCVILSLVGLYLLYTFSIMFSLPMGKNILYTIIMILSGVISYWSVSVCRHGAWLKEWKWASSFIDMFRKRSSRPFTSAMHAQIWFELRQTGYILPLSGLCVIGITLGITVSTVVISILRNGQFHPMSSAVPFMFYFIAPAAAIGGLIAFAVFYREFASRAYIFWMRQPMATRTLAVARLYATAASLARLLGIFAIVILVIVVYDWAIGMFDIMALSPVKWALKSSSKPEAITMSLLGLFAFAVIYWTLFRAGPVLLIGNWILSILMIIPSMIWGWEVVWSQGLDALVFILPSSILCIFYLARRRNLITTGTLVIAVCLFPLVVVSLWAFPWWEAVFGSPKGHSDLNYTQIICVIAAATLPFIPVVGTPLLMDKLRHR
jgi:hypothetical protein